MGIMRSLSRYDNFQKAKDYATVQTVSGATVSIAAGILMLLLFLSEVSYWRTTKVENHLLVDATQADREFDIGMDVTFHALACGVVSVAAEDAKTVPYDESHVRITRTPLPPAGSSLSSAVASADKGGCRVKGTVRVRKVAGVIYIAAPRTLANIDGRLMFTVTPEVMSSFNASHTIHSLSFGPAFPDQVSPLSGVTSAPIESTAAYQYHIKVVPTLYEYLYGTVVDSQQYSVSDFVQGYDPAANGYIHPGVWFKFDFSPIMVRLVETRRSFLQFIVSLCAILGGVFALSGVVDQVFYRAIESRKEK